MEIQSCWDIWKPIIRLSVFFEKKWKTPEYKVAYQEIKDIPVPTQTKQGRRNIKLGLSIMGTNS